MSFQELWVFVHSEQRARGLLWWLSGKKFTCSAGDTGNAGWIPGWEDPGHGNPRQYSCLEKSHGQKAWRDSQSIGLKRVGHGGSNWTCTHARTELRFMIRLSHSASRSYETVDEPSANSVVESRILSDQGGSVRTKFA